jgi:hypothetical protein
MLLCAHSLLSISICPKLRKLYIPKQAHTITIKKNTLNIEASHKKKIINYKGKKVISESDLKKRDIPVNGIKIAIRRKEKTV